MENVVSALGVPFRRLSVLTLLLLSASSGYATCRKHAAEMRLTEEIASYCRLADALRESEAARAKAYAREVQKSLARGCTCYEEKGNTTCDCPGSPAPRP